MADTKPNPWTKLPIPLAWLHGLDECSAPNVLRDAFGDGYLYKLSPLFARVRDVAHELGYRYSSVDTVLQRDYHALPLLALRDILGSRTIPYIDNAASVRRLLEQQPKLALTGSFIASIITANHAFHESAHCVAHTLLEPFRGALGPERESFVVGALFEESFANAVENLGRALSHMPVPDIVFYNLNSYMRKADESPKLKSLLDCGEPRLAFRLLLLALFEANLTDEKPDERTRLRVAEAAGATAHDGEVADAAVDIAFGLSEGFRGNTTPNYFRLLGYSEDYESVAKAGWLDNEAHREAARGVADKLFAEVASAAWERA